MAGTPTPDAELINLLHVWEDVERNQSKAAKALSMNRKTFCNRLNVALKKQNEGTLKRPFEAPVLPTGDLTLDELKAYRRKVFLRKDEGAQARKLIPVKVNLRGPIGILHFGDPHVDDDGCDFPRLEADIELVKRTPGLLAGNVGDLHNNWIGRLARLYSQQSTTAKQAWMLVEWLVTSIPWLYLVKGNHDLWSGDGDPLDFIKRFSEVGVMEAHGARLELQFPNGKKIRVNARHDFSGHSMWNPNHGPVKAIKMGWRDHIMSCGHIHETGFGPPLKCPSSGLISWPLRCAGYKKHDRYGDQLGLPDQNISPSILTVIDPRYDDDDPKLITPFLSAEAGARYLTLLRKEAEASSGQRRNPERL